MTTRGRTIWTIGYEGHDGASLVEKLRKAKLQRVVDIRELPLSRKPGFSKRGLALGLQAAGIEYSHVRALGTPRVARHAYKAGGSFEEFRQAYLAHVAKHEDAVRELEALASKERCCLLCVEADAERCHRGVLARDVLAPRGWRVVDL